VVAAGFVLENRYRLDAHIASGGMGEVWEGTDLLLDRRVAVKLVRPEYASDEELLTRFRAEAHHAGSLSHPNIAQVYDFHEVPPPGHTYLVMEFVDGSSLAWLLGDGPLDPARALDIIAQAARGLSAAHQAGVVHRDIKPGNLLIRRDGLVKLSDFGIARAADSAHVTRTGFLPGTPVYMAPERASGAGATPASDLYSLGVVAYQCLTGEVPFEGEPLAVAIAHIEQEMPPLPAWVPAPVAALVTDLTSKDPAARPSSAAEVAARAEQARAVPSPTVTPAADDTPALPVPAVAVAVPTELAATAREARTRTSRFPRRAALAPLALSSIAAVGLIGWLLAARSTPVTPQPPAPVASARPSHHPPRRVPAAAVPAVSAGPGAPAAASSPRPRASRSTSPEPSPSAAATPSPTPALTPSPTVSPSPAPSPSPTLPEATPSPTDPGWRLY
jgi:eukaryotic-like serine/threonine-protein kinase